MDHVYIHFFVNCAKGSVSKGLIAPMLLRHGIGERGEIKMAEITERQIEQSEESEAEYVQRIKLGNPSLVHRKKFTCAGCGRVLGYGPPGGIGSDVYHPACAEIESAARRAWNLKRAMG